MARKLNPLQVSITSDRVKDLNSSFDKMSDYVQQIVPKGIASRRNDALSQSMVASSQRDSKRPSAFEIIGS